MIHLLKKDFIIIPSYVYILFLTGMMIGHLFLQISIVFIGIVLAVIFPISLFLYDRQKQTNQTFVCLPIKRETLVFSRYVYSVLMILAITLCMTAVMTLASFFPREGYILTWQGGLFFIAFLFYFLATGLPHYFLYSVNIASFVVFVWFSVLFTNLFVILFNFIAEDSAGGLSFSIALFDRQFDAFIHSWSSLGILGFFAGSVVALGLSYMLSAYAFKRKDLTK